jgi:uncharacterized protein YdeI (YjbR/CyaY-like superfamily)
VNTSVKITKTYYAANREEWRAWLEKNHDKGNEIWLIYYKRHSGKPRVAYEDAVEEALCFGWIDSVIQRMDDERYMQKFTPRRNDSKWSALNKRRVAKLVKEGRLTEAGFKKLNYTNERDDYGRTPQRNKEELKPPPFLKKEFMKNRKVWDAFNRLAPSYRRNYIRWISAAKTKETQDKRIKEAVTLLNQNKKLGLK